MSPTKRALSPPRVLLGGEAMSFDLTGDASGRPTFASAKRLRGGGGEGGGMPDTNEEGLLLGHYEEEDDYVDEVQPVPDEVESGDAGGNAEGPSGRPDQIVFSDITDSMRRRWLRPPNRVTDNSSDLSLLWFDMDLMGGPALERNPNETKADRRAVGSSSGEVPIVRAYGVTEAGNSVAVFIHGFTPYGYFALPPGSAFANTEENLAKIRVYLNQRLEGQARGSKLHEYCRAVHYVTSHKSIMGYESPHTHFFKVIVAMPTLIPTLKRIMEEGIDLPGVTVDGSGRGEHAYTPFECNVPFVLRYMIDRDISGAGWMTLPKRTYQLRPAYKKYTHCQVRIGKISLLGPRKKPIRGMRPNFIDFYFHPSLSASSLLPASWIHPAGSRHYLH